MRITTSVLEDLTTVLPHLKPQVYFKSSLVALSHAMEDQVLAGSGEEMPLVIATFQRERFYRMEAGRYARIAKATPHVYVMAAPETEFQNSSRQYETIAFADTEPLCREWNLVVLSENYGTCLVCEERYPQDIHKIPTAQTWMTQANLDADPARRFEGIWTFDRALVLQVTDLLFARVIHYRPELAAKIHQARDRYGIPAAFSAKFSSAPQAKSPSSPAAASSPSSTRSPSSSNEPAPCESLDPQPFAERLISYLQAGQYKLLRAYRSISAQERKERLINTIVATIRRSLNPAEILDIAVRELGEALLADRCTIYRCHPADETTTITCEYTTPGVKSIRDQIWKLKDIPLFHEVTRLKEGVFLDDTAGKATARSRMIRQIIDRLEPKAPFFQIAQTFNIHAWLMVPVLYQGRLLGIVELHHCHAEACRWTQEDLQLVSTIATQIGTALVQAETHTHLEELNQQLEALERTRSNLIAITGHELRTPLSTIQICLESLANEPDMPAELRQVMLDTALADADRLRELVQDFLTLSRFESGRVEWTWEPLSLQECIDLARSSLHSYSSDRRLPAIHIDLEDNLPLVSADGEWLVQVLSKLLDNACKFTPTSGVITVQARLQSIANPADHQAGMVQAGTGQAAIVPDIEIQEGMLATGYIAVTVADTGRGIEPDRLEIIFERFYQEEGALQRSVGGTGLGLAICRQAIGRWGGKIWAESAGKDRGSQFHFTLPIADPASVDVQGGRILGTTGSSASSLSALYRQRL